MDKEHPAFTAAWDYLKDLDSSFAETLFRESRMSRLSPEFQQRAGLKQIYPFVPSGAEWKKAERNSYQPDHDDLHEGFNDLDFGLTS